MASGIYKITNKINGHCYIGSAIDINKRWIGHKKLLKKDKHHSRHLQNAWNKYGSENFIFSVVEYCFPLALIFREQHFIDTVKPEYNLSPTAGNTLGYKHTPEARANMSAAGKGRVFTPEHRAKIAEANKRRIYTPEMRENISAGQRGRVLSKEHREKIAIASKKSLTKEHLAKMLERASITNARARAGISNRGRKHSPETINKMSLTHKKWWSEKKNSIQEEE